MAFTLEDTLVLEEISVNGYERVIKITDDKVGLKAIICIHNSTMGPTLGGTRIYPYPSFEAALTDVKRLALGMTYKSAIAQTGLGGAKSVIIADPKKDKTPELLHAFGQAVHRLGGAYICAEDVGSTAQDMLIIQQATPYVVGLAHEKSSGDPGPYTAWGTFRGIQSVLQKIYGKDSLENRKIAVQGLGSVGGVLVEHLFWAGAKLIVSDIDRGKMLRLAKLYGAEYCPPEEILSVECDVLSPCALGGIVNAQTIAKMRCKAIAGSANNQLLKESDAEELMKKNILYAPDFVINAGGLINVVHELEPAGYQPQMSRQKIHQIYDELMKIYEIAQQNQFSTNAAAVSLGNYRLRYGIGKRQTPIYFHHSNHIL